MYIADARPIFELLLNFWWRVVIITVLEMSQLRLRGRQLLFSTGREWPNTQVLT